MVNPDADLDAADRPVIGHQQGGPADGVVQKSQGIGGRISPRRQRRQVALDLD